MSTIIDQMTQIYCFIDDYLKALPKRAAWRSSPNSEPAFTDAIEAARQCDGFRFSLYAIDSKPIPVCKPIRHRVVRLLRDEGAYFGKTSAGWLFGFKLHVLINIEGQVVAAALTPANVADRETSVWLATAADGGILAADQAYGRDETCEALEREAEMLVLTRKRARPKKGLMSRARQPIETFFAKLCHQFIDKVYSRSFEGYGTQSS